jgi:predicted TIM-barrel fold metal-dependent hydrolase
MDRYIVVSSDCHAGLPPEQYREYLDPQYREIFDMALPLEIAMREKVESRFLIKDVNNEWRKGLEAGLRGAWSYDERIEVLDADGIAAEVVFADGITERNAPPFGVGLAPPVRGPNVPPPDLIFAGSRAHNRWLSELCQADRHRHIGVGAVPLPWDVQRAVAEVEWLVQNGMRSVMIPPITGQFESYNNTMYDPFWAVCQDHGVIIHFHSGAAELEQYFGLSWPDIDERSIGGVALMGYEQFHLVYRPILFMLWGGVFERFPKLKTVVTEIGTTWMIPPMLRSLDYSYHDRQFTEKLGDYTSHLSMAPSEYFRRNVGIGASCMNRTDVSLRNEVGLHQLMWGSDYPHPEGTWPATRQKMYDAFVGIPEDDVALLLGENAIRFYDLDRDALAKIAARVGPKRSDFLG